MANKHFDLLRPSGCIHISSNGTTPSYGTWEQIADGCLLMNTHNAQKVNTKYGHRGNTLPKHTHGISIHEHGNIFIGDGADGSINPTAGSLHGSVGTNSIVKTSVNRADLHELTDIPDGNLALYKVVSIFKRKGIDGGINFSEMSEAFDICFPIGTIWYGYNANVFDMSDIALDISFCDFGKKRVLVGFDNNDSAFNTLKKEGGYSEVQLGGHGHISYHGHDIAWARLSGNNRLYAAYQRVGQQQNIPSATGTSTGVIPDNPSTPIITSANKNSNYQRYIALYCRERIS